MRGNVDKLHLARAISPVSVADTTAQTSEYVDVKGYNKCTFAIAIGSVADADATFAVTMTECDTSGGSYTAVAAADISGTLTLAGFQFDDDNEVRKVGYKGSKRYVKLVITPSANASAALMSAVAVLEEPALAPTANPPV